MKMISTNSTTAPIIHQVQSDSSSFLFKFGVIVLLAIRFSPDYYFLGRINLIRLGKYAGQKSFMYSYPGPSGVPDDSEASVQRISETVSRKINVPIAQTGNPYIALTDIQQALLRPEMFIGSMVFKPRKVYGFNAGNVGEMMINLCTGMIRLFIEVLTNAGDNVEKTRRNGRDPGKVYVSLTNSTIVVRNEGDTIPIELHPQFPDQYNPQVVFGQMRVSSTYGKDSIGAGINGLGVKLTNIFSTHFRVEVGDKQRHARYSQEWGYNMTQVGPPQIDWGYSGENYVQVTYLTDFARFNQQMQGYSNLDLSHFAFLCVLLSCGKQIEVILNYPEIGFSQVQGPDGLLYPTQSIEQKTITIDYRNKVIDGKEVPASGLERLALQMFGGKLAEEPKEEIKDKNLPEKRGRFGKKVEVKPESKHYVSFSIPSNEGYTYLAEVTLLNTPGNGAFYSFVNGPLPTFEGGEHVNVMYKSFGDPLLEQMKKKLEQVKKEMEDAMSLTHLVTISHVKKNISMLLSVQMKNPALGGGQEKSKLDDFPFKITIPAKVSKILSTWSVGNELKKLLDNKFKTELKKTDGMRGSNLKLKSKLRNANNAGGAESLKCALWPTEGDSGATYLISSMKYIPGGWDYNGILPLRGKIINPLNAEAWKLCRNKEYHLLKKSFGLIEGVDGEEALRHLNYGSLVISTDADVDGSHIKGLIINIMWLWPKLVAMGIIKFLRTPIKRVYYQGQWHALYTSTHVEQMAALTNNFKNLHKDHIQHCKGLGSSSDREGDIARDWQNPYIVTLVADPYSDYGINLVFNSERIKEKKTWMSQWKYQPIADSNMQNISEFIDREMGEFCQYNLKRSVPNVCGHKPSIIKILYAAIKRWKYKPNGEYFKVAQLAAYVASETCYHHGEVSLEEAIFCLAQDYPGSNNLPYFDAKGNTGTRDKNGKDHAKARYVHVRPSWWFPLVFRKEDDALLELQEDDGSEIEPRTLLPTIPLIAINGSSGIGSGWSTEIPSHKPLDCCEYLIDLIMSKGAAMPKKVIKPWFRGFTGQIELLKKRAKAPVTTVKIFTRDPTMPGDPASHPQQEMIDEIAGRKFKDSSVTEQTRPLVSIDEVTINNPNEVGDVLMSFGRWRQEGDVTIIDEIPIFTSIYSYDKFLDEMREAGIIKSKRTKSEENRPYFEVRGMSNPNFKSLQLAMGKSMRNMTFLDEERKPVRLDRIDEVIKRFYHMRLPYYYKRKQWLIEECQKELVAMKWKWQFVHLINQGKIVVHGQVTEESVLESMRPYGIPVEVYHKAKIRQLNRQGEAKLVEQINRQEAELIRLTQLIPEQLWLNDIHEFMEGYKKHYKGD